MKIQVAPSVLSADFGKLNEEIATIEKYCDRLHYDVMDGHFVPNISFGAPILKWIKSELPIDVHLMIEHPWLFFEDFVKAGGDLLIVHSEACSEPGGEFDLKNVLLRIKGLGVKTGVSIKPKTSVDTLKGALGDEWLRHVDQVLVMTVEPGFGGQSFMSDMVPKISQLREMGFKGDIGVDGGINAETAKICREAGANVLVAGNYIFNSENRVASIGNLTK